MKYVRAKSVAFWHYLVLLGSHRGHLLPGTRNNCLLDPALRAVTICTVVPHSLNCWDEGTGTLRKEWRE
jgi:hypothetical protein